MERRKETSSFNASTEGGFTESGAWLIAPRLWFHDDLSTDKRAAVSDEARRQLLGRVLDEALRGKRLGAERVQVALESGERVTVIGPGEKTGEDPL